MAVSSSQIYSVLSQLMTDNTLYFDDWRFFISARFLASAVEKSSRLGPSEQMNYRDASG